MLLGRRQVLGGMAALAAMPSRVGAQDVSESFRAQIADLQLLPEQYAKTRVWGFEGLMPGPEIRLQQGQRVRKRLINDLPDATSTHWHGIRIDNDMDGVAGLTQAAVAPGDSFSYDFVAPDAGTFWYHAHNRSFEQVARGLYGALIVEEPTPPDVDREETLILDDWRLDPDTAQISSDFGAPHDLSHAGRMGNFVGTNGVGNLSLGAKKNERLRLRVINASNARIFQLSLAGLEGWIVAVDGMPLPAPRPVTDEILLGSAQRVDLIVDVTADEGETAHLARQERDGLFSQVAFNVSGTSSVQRRDAPAPLPRNNHPAIDLGSATRITLRMEGGAMGGLRSAILEGESQPMRNLMQAGKFWAFNGAIGGMDGEPLADVSLGQPLLLEIVNDTVFPHAMHVHGMHFWEVQDDGTLGDYRDTTMIARGASREIAFVADNPGNWLIHCHMLSHAVSGMMTWMRVRA